MHVASNRRFFFRLLLWLAVPLVLVAALVVLALPSGPVTLTAYHAIQLGMHRAEVERTLGMPRMSPDEARMELVIDGARSMNAPPSTDLADGNPAAAESICCWRGDGAVIWTGQDADGAVVWKRFATIPREAFLARLWGRLFGAGAWQPAGLAT